MLGEEKRLDDFRRRDPLAGPERIALIVLALLAGIAIITAELVLR